MDYDTTPPSDSDYSDVYREFDEEMMMDKTEESPIASASASVPIASAPMHSVTQAKMCEILIETYNTSIIDYFRPELLDAVSKQAALQCAGENVMLDDGEIKRKRNVLARLINNKLTLPKPYQQIDFIGGPFNITYHWSNKYKKGIYIWGEWHDEKTECPQNTGLKINIEDFLQHFFFTNPIVFSDFYLEMEAYVVPDGYDYRGYGLSKYRIDILRNRFGPCIGPERDDSTYCHNSRMHFFDIRQGKVKSGMNSASLFQSEITSFVFNIKEELKGREPEEKCLNIDLLNKITEFIQRWKSFLYFFARFDNLEFDTRLNHKKFWYDQLLTFNIVKKEISVMHADVRPFLNIFIKKELDDQLRYDYTNIGKNAGNVLNIYKRIQKFKDEGFVKDELFIKHFGLKYKNINFLINSIDSLFSNEIMIFNALISDAYLLARIFKTFQIYDPDKKRATDEPEEPHNIIIYAGNAHSQRYRKFLKCLGFRLLEESGGLEAPLPGQGEHCVDMRPITQPLFSSWPYDIEDNLIDTDYFADYFSNPNPSSYSSFDSVFRVDITNPFDQPVVPNDLSMRVSVEQGQYGKTKGMKNKSTPYSRSKR